MTGSAVLSVAAAVRSGALPATAVVEQTLDDIAAGDQQINSFITVLRERALADAKMIDRRVAAGEDPGPLAGVPFAVKDLYDVAGEVTRAGSVISAEDAPASTDAAAVARVANAGGVLVGTLNMDEYSYGFTTENSHYGACRNPHDHARVAGGSSGGSAAAVAAGFVPFALGSDTNGSVRVPAALCGVFGLKPTFGRLPRAGMYPFSASLDHVGILAATVADLAAIFSLLEPAPVAAAPASEPLGIADLRIAVAGGYFERGGTAAALNAVTALASALGVTENVVFPEVARARGGAGHHRGRRRSGPPRAPPPARRGLRSDDPRPLPGGGDGPGRHLPRRAALSKLVS